MGKKLSEDEIKWILSVESSEAQQNIHKLTKENQKLAASNKALTKEMTELVAQGKKESQEYKNLDKALQSNNQQISKNKKLIGALTDKLNINELTMAQLRKRAKELARQLENTSRAAHPEEYARLNNQLKATNARIGQLNNSGKQIASMFSAANVARGVFVAGLATVTMSLRNSISMLKDFEKGTANLAAVLGTTRSQIKPLIDEAKRLGATTAFTASQVISLETELAKLGYTQLEIIQSTKSVLAFAGATGAELPNAAKLAGAALRMFGLDASQMDRVVSTLAVSTTKSALDFGYLENALSTVGPVAKTFGFTIEDTVALLGTLANSGFDASSAATATRNILLNLADSSGKLAKALGEPVKSFDELIPALSLLKSQGVDLATTLELTDKRSVAAFNSFLSGTDTVLTLRDSITDCGEALKAMQLEKLNTLSGSTALLSSSWEGLLLKFEGSNGILKSLVDFLTKIVDTISSLVDWSSKYTAYIKAGTVAVLTYIGVQKASLFLKRQHLIATGQVIASSKLENALLKTNTFLITAKNTLVGILTGKIKVATAAQQMWNVVTSAHPLVAIGSAILGVISYLSIFKTTTDENTISQRNFADSIDETKAAIDRMKGIRLKDANRDTLNKRQLQELRTQSEQELEIKENEIAKETALMREVKEQKEAIQNDEEKMKDKANIASYVQLKFEEKMHRQNIEVLKGDIKELQAIIDSIPKKNFILNDDKSDPNAVALKNMQSSHEQEINEIRLAGREKEQTEDEINVAILESDKAYYAKRIQQLEKFKKTEKKSSKQAEYQKQIVDAKAKLLNTEVLMEKQTITKLQKLRDKDLSNENRITKQQQISLLNQLANRKITQEQYDMLMLSSGVASADTRLAIEQRYLNDVNDLELKNGQIKADTVKQANDAVIVAEQNSANARASIQMKMNDLVKDFKSQFKLTTVAEDLQLQLQVLDAAYEARKQLAEKENLDITELTAAHERARAQIIQDSENRINQIRNQYGLLNQKEQFNLELQQLKDHLDAKELTEEEYEDAVQNLKRDSFKKQFDYYLNLFSGAVQALQQAEMDNVDAKYDAEIEAAQGNADEVERLETEKAQKKLDIEKKYADVNFAIKASQIIADTAVAIMKAIADLGPIAGPIAAALMGATGLAQLASANAERQKVKNMTLSGSKSSSKNASRVITGKEEGGKIDVTRSQDGKLFKDADYDPDARGFIDKPTVIVGEGPAGKSKEWVASNATVENPTIAPFIHLLDQHQQAGDIATVDMNQIIRQRMAGFSSGGSISSSQSNASKDSKAIRHSASSLDDKEFFDKLTGLFEAYLREVKAYVVLDELNKKQELKDKSEKAFTRGDH